MNSNESYATDAQAGSAIRTLDHAEYRISLKTLEQFADYGVIMALYGQIDLLLTELLGTLSGKPSWRVYEEMDRATLGPKIIAFKKLASKLKGELRTLSLEINDEIGDVLRDRNLLTHGMWAFHLVPGIQTSMPRMLLKGHRPISPTELPTIASRLVAFTRKLGRLYDSTLPQETSEWTKPRVLHIALENIDLAAHRLDVKLGY